jgi:hypothetical protein
VSAGSGKAPSRKLSRRDGAPARSVLSIGKVVAKIITASAPKPLQAIVFQIHGPGPDLPVGKLDKRIYVDRNFPRSVAGA